VGAIREAVLSAILSKIKVRIAEALKKIYWFALVSILACVQLWLISPGMAQDPGELEMDGDISSSLEQVLEEVLKDEPRHERSAARVYTLMEIREDYAGRTLTFPSRVCVDPVSGEIYAVDSGNNRILVFTYDYYPLFSVDYSDGIEFPSAVAVGQDGYLFVAQSRSSRDLRPRISVFNPALVRERDIYFTGFEGAEDFKPASMAIGRNNNLYIAGYDYFGLIVLDRDGNFLRVITPRDQVAGSGGKMEKVRVRALDIDSRGWIYILSEDSGRVYVYDQDEEFVHKFGEKGGTWGKLSRPLGLSVDHKKDRVYVIDYMRHTANAYCLDGKFLFDFGGRGWGRGWFNFPSDISVDAFGNILVADTFNHRVQVFSLR